ncbi:hypothetical protein N5853_07515 [Bartonella sp. HY329]|uniref:hypothetical protein n=1 Tax=unclassified Bartonella TaxID=2645622 RepID=UPI0021C76076|nr:MULTISPECIES: hypothetical protein [unclassified Bartonella]UXM93976.1 hypothetical protein N5853_07515 [Bartonella sp. HY329]UXN08297.1 hypothetical protein N5852_07525 [Bartonella sp. HY328]
MKEGVLNGLNEEARAILLVAINTGARLAEISHLTPECIHLNAKVPHVEIAPYT